MRETRSVFLVFGFVLGLTTALNVLAGEGETIQNLSRQLDEANLAKANGLNAMSLADADEAPIKKEQKLWDEQIKVITTQVNGVSEKMKIHNGDAQVVNGKVDRHNAGCTGTVPKPTYDRCKGEEPYLQSEINRINGNAARLKKEKDALDKRVKDIETRQGELNRSLQQVRARYDAAKSSHDAAVKRIASLTARLKSDCAKAKTPEGMAYCGQVDWDGARPGLTAPGLQPRPFSATPNR